MIADYERMNFSVSQCRWEQEKISTQNIGDILSVAAANNSGSDDTVFPTAAIAGVAVGAAALVGIAGLIFYFIRRRKNAEKRRLAELEEKNDASSSASDPSSSRAGFSTPFGGELGGGDIHEMPHQGRQWVQEMHSSSGADPRKVGYSEMEGQPYFWHGKGFANEMPANHAVYEMSGTDVHELPNGRMSKMGSVEVQELPTGRFSQMSKDLRSQSRSGWL